MVLGQTVKGNLRCRKIPQLLNCLIIRNDVFGYFIYQINVKCLVRTAEFLLDARVVKKTLFQPECLPARVPPRAQVPKLR